MIKQTNKRTLALFRALILCAGLPAACSGKEGQSQQNSPKSESAVERAPLDPAPSNSAGFDARKEGQQGGYVTR